MNAGFKPRLGAKSQIIEQGSNIFWCSFCIVIAASVGCDRINNTAYHDENENSRLDKNAFGIPTERYGFSKNPKRGYGPPMFSETAIELISAKQLSDSNVTLKVPIQIK